MTELESREGNCDGLRVGFVDGASVGLVRMLMISSGGRSDRRKRRSRGDKDSRLSLFSFFEIPRSVELEDRGVRTSRSRVSRNMDFESFDSQRGGSAGCGDEESWETIESERKGEVVSSIDDPALEGGVEGESWVTENSVDGVAGGREGIWLEDAENRKVRAQS